MPEPLQTLTGDSFLVLKHPLQPRRFALALFFALILFPLIAAALLAGTIVLIVPVFALLFWWSGRTLFAYFMSNSILVSELNYPRIYRIGEELKRSIEYPKPVNIFVYEQGDFNAKLTKFFFYRRAVFLNSEVLEAGVTDDELRWLIGRFVGYLKARRLAGFWGWTIRAAQHLLVFNLFLLPYERALVYSGDRIALAVINGDLTSAISAMQKLLVGRQLGYSVNPNGIVDQHRLVKGSFFAFCARLGMAFPHMTARYVDLIEFAKEKFPVQFERFDAENPGLPPDLRKLAALPQAVVVQPARDPVWASLTGAVVFLGLLSLLTYKVIAPQLSHVRPAAQAQLVPASMEVQAAASPATDSRQTEAATVASQPEAPVSVPQRAPYISETGRFSVLFPGTPKRNASQVSLSGTDSVILQEFQFDGDNSSYLVMYNDYPEKYVPADPQLLLKSIRDGSTESLKGTVTSDEAIDLDGVPGRAFKFTDKTNSTYVARVFLAGHRLYQVMVVVSANSSAAQAEEFLNSFRIR